MRVAPRERLIVALDVSSVEAAEAMVKRLGDAVTFYKIGYQLAYAGGLPYARTLADAGKQVFLDLKLHDIGNTVAEGVKSISRLGATFLTVHAFDITQFQRLLLTSTINVGVMAQHFLLSAAAKSLSFATVARMSEEED